MEELDSTIFNYARDDDFSKFEQAIRSNLAHKIANDEEISAKLSDYDRIQKMKGLFAQITQIDKSEED
jgi:hypothetical protein